jgi:hypothetical protein
MSEPSLTMPRSVLKAFLDYIPDAMRHEIPVRLLELAYTPTSTDTAAKQPRRKKLAPDPDTYSPIEHTLYSVQTFGFTHPSHGRYLMVPKEFQAILLLETKAVAAVVWEVMQQTIGWEGNGPGGRREWAPLTVRHFVRARMLAHRHATKGIADALDKGYIERRLIGARRYEYRLRWKGTN